MEYSVTVTEVIAKEYIVQADDEEEAERKAIEGDGNLGREKLIRRDVTDIGATTYRKK